jgi:hypothetical protein
MENWKKSPSHPGYLVSDLGRVMSEKNKIPLAGSRAGAGYRKIAFAKMPHMYVHHLVLEAFVGSKPDGLQCRHLNGNREDNRLCNLVWGTAKQNSEDRELHGTVCYGEKNPMAKLDQSQVLEMRKIRSETGMPYHKIAENFNVSTMTAYRAITKQSWR